MVIKERERVAVKMENAERLMLIIYSHFRLFH